MRIYWLGRAGSAFLCPCHFVELQNQSSKTKTLYLDRYDTLFISTHKYVRAWSERIEKLKNRNFTVGLMVVKIGAGEDCWGTL